MIGRFPGETSCLTLVWAVLDLYITHAKNGVRLSLSRPGFGGGSGARMICPGDRRACGDANPSQVSG